MSCTKLQIFTSIKGLLATLADCKLPAAILRHITSDLDQSRYDVPDLRMASVILALRERSLSGRWALVSWPAKRQRIHNLGFWSLGLPLACFWGTLDFISKQQTPYTRPE